MFEVKPRVPFDKNRKANDGDLFDITCSRDELTRIRLALSFQTHYESYREIWSKIAEVTD